ncbi:hypothetical protein [Microbispora sp. NBC_01389]|uniref:hypothetical protein n=1 Tax=Microbispora sp. NBC_01389 TaxID=2903584 RepID=UPI003248D465
MRHDEKAGIMRGVTTRSGEPWDDLSEPAAKTVERPRVIRIVYSETDDGWRASSPDLRSIKMTRLSLSKLKRDLRARLMVWLDPDIAIDEIVKHSREPMASHVRVSITSRPDGIPVAFSSSGHPATRSATVRKKFTVGC